MNYEIHQVSCTVFDSQITVHMPGGMIEISLDSQFLATMSGSVCRIGEGNLSAEAVNYR